MSDLYNKIDKVINELGKIKKDKKQYYFVDKNIFDELIKIRKRAIMKPRSSEDTIFKRLSRLNVQ